MCPALPGGLPEILGLMPRASAAMSTLEFSRSGVAGIKGEGGGDSNVVGEDAAGRQLVVRQGTRQAGSVLLPNEHGRAPLGGGMRAGCCQVG
jgi:hypothetical protein